MQDGYHSLPPGKIAAVVTYLDMTVPPPLRALPASDLALRHVIAPPLDWYRDLYRAVGSEWLWFSRLSMPDEVLSGHIHAPSVDVYALEREGHEIGLLELDFRKSGDCELLFFGVTADAIGSGAGRFLMNAAIERAFAHKPAISRFWLHTCTLDHPGALNFYRRSGFQPYKREIEIATDPRLDGRVSRDAAGWYPVL